jgi:hypothetical protein
VIESLVLFALVWLIGGGAKLGKKPGGGGIAPEPRPPGPAPGKPRDVPWPKEPSPAQAEKQDLAARAAEEQKRKNALQARLDADAQEAVNKAKAANDQEALADIARKKREKQKALDMMQEDINRANAAAMSAEMNRPPKA